MSGKLDGHAIGLSHRGKRYCVALNLLFHHFHLPFYLADRREIFIKLSPVGLAHARLETMSIIRDEIEDALPGAGVASARSRIPCILVVAEEAFEDRSWINLGRIG